MYDQAMTDPTAEITYLKDYRAPDFAVPRTELTFDIRAEATVVKARLSVEPSPDRPEGAGFRLDGEALTLVSVGVDGVPLGFDGYSVDASGLTVLAPPDEPFVLDLVVEIDPASNTELMGLYRSSGVWCTQCEPEGFRRMVYFPDRPDVLSVYTVRIEADEKAAPVLLSNGNLIDSGQLSNGRHFAVWHDPFPKPSYLFALVAGDLGHISDSFTTVSGREIALGIYCEHGKEDKCLYAMDALKRAMAWDEKRFGREYDLDLFNIVAVSDFNFGAMENKGLNIFNDRYVLADPETATDADYANIEGVIAHEYFHNWTGNRITCRDWFQLCLKEGLTVYRDQEFSSDMRSRAVKRIEDVVTLKAAQFPEDAGPLAHAARPESFREIENFYTATVYEKGAEIVRMLATRFGEDGFRKGFEKYFELHDGQAVTIEDWLGSFEAALGVDLDHFLQWYRQAGTPEVLVSDAYDAETQTYTLTLKQVVCPTPGQPTKQPMVIPVKFGLVGPNGADLAFAEARGAKIEDDLIILDDYVAEISFSGVSSRPVPSLFRGFSAPVAITSEMSDADRLFLARHDNDPFGRWQALQDVALQLLSDAARNGGALTDPAAVDGLVAALGDTLADDTLDNAFKALALSLPDENTIAQHLAHDVDPDAVRSARLALIERIGSALATPLGVAYATLAGISSPYSIGAEATRARSLRNQCMALLARGGADSGRVAAHYHNADNMTDRIAALSAAVAADLPAVDDLLADFRERFAGDPLLFDKWLQLVAARPGPETLDRVRAVFNEPDFPRQNPNRVRSLIGGFSARNPAQFARADGEGFKFVAAVCADLDTVNAQLAARLLTAFRSFRLYEPTRQAHAKAVLESLASREMSRNTSDILSRILSQET